MDFISKDIKNFLVIKTAEIVILITFIFVFGLQLYNIHINELDLPYLVEKIIQILCMLVSWRLLYILFITFLELSTFSHLLKTAVTNVKNNTKEENKKDDSK